MLHIALWGMHIALCRTHTVLWGTPMDYSGRGETGSAVEVHGRASQRALRKAPSGLKSPQCGAGAMRGGDARP
jgi:hypothetical protein